MPALHHPDPPLQDDAVLLRPWRAGDLPGLLAGFRDPVVQLHSWPSSAPYDEADARQFLVDQEQGRLAGVQVQWALVAPDDPDRLLGGGSLYDLDPEQRVGSVGYWLVPQARGRGVATRAVWLVVRWALADLGLARLVLTCGPENTASQRVAARAGFRRARAARGDALQGRAARHRRPCPRALSWLRQ